MFNNNFLINVLHITKKIYVLHIKKKYICYTNIKKLHKIIILIKKVEVEIEALCFASFSLFAGEAL
jgi:hypothetical protein